MKSQLLLAALVLGAVVGCTQARTLQQQYSSGTAVSVSGGSGPNGNCGQTSTVGNAQAFASGPPCLSPIIPAPPPSASCPSTTVTVDWALPASGGSFKPLTLCPGSTVSFKWNTETASTVYGLYQIPSGTCPSSASDKDVRLITTPASSPNKQGVVSATLDSPATYWFTDLTNCNKGQLQEVIISPTAGAAARGVATSNSG